MTKEDLVQQLEEMLSSTMAVMTTASERMKDAEGHLAFKKKMSKRQRLAEMEVELTIIQPLFYAMVADRLQDTIAVLRKEVATDAEMKKATDWARAIIRLNVLKKGDG